MENSVKYTCIFMAYFNTLQSEATVSGNSVAMNFMVYFNTLQSEVSVNSNSASTRSGW